MTRLTMVLLTGMISASSWSACSYDLDARRSTIAEFYLGSQRFPIIEEQKALFNVREYSLIEYRHFLASNEKDVKRVRKGIEIPQSGIIAYEYKLKVPSLLLPGDDALFTPYNIAHAFFNSGSTDIFVMYENNLPNSDHPLGIYIGNSSGPSSGDSTYIPVTSSSDGFQKVGIYINQDSKQIGVIYNGVNKGYISTIPDKIKSLSFIPSMSYRVGLFSPNVGNEHSIELVTDKDQFQFTYPIETKDICGNTI
ncbi:DUF4882 family protein [Acinetobacter nematophilus]|uniref:DUF4882 family protein n=1 Tax=Acinetobacter nematophilus TaxID=2994642 RepID=UPI003AF6B765